MHSHSFAFRPALEPLDPRLVPAVLFVDDDKAQRPNAPYTSIQAAVDAASPGDKIRVYPGTYREQVRVTKDNLTLESVGEHKAVIRPPAGGVTGKGILVTITDDADGVVFDGFTVRGPDESGNLYAGIAVGFGSSAKITDNLVTNIRNQPLDGAQTGLGILVQEADAVIDGNTVRGYQKAGIVAFGPGNVVIRDNDVTGSGPTNKIAQIGIQVSDGANGVVTGNRVSENDYVGPVANGEAAGIFVFQAGTVAVTDNRVDDNQIGIAAEVQKAGLVVSGNKVTDSTTDGIRIDGSENVVLLGNRVDDSRRYGIAVLGASKNVLVALNRVSDSGEYDLYDGTAAGSNVVFVGNRFRTRN